MLCVVVHQKLHFLNAVAKCETTKLHCYRIPVLLCIKMQQHRAKECAVPCVLPCSIWVVHAGAMDYVVVVRRTQYFGPNP